MGPITGSNRIQHNPPKKTTNRDQLKGPGFLRDQGKGSAKGFIFHSPKKRPIQKTNFYKTKKKDQKKRPKKRPIQKTNSKDQFPWALETHRKTKDQFPWTLSPCPFLWSPLCPHAVPWLTLPSPTLCPYPVPLPCCAPLPCAPSPTLSVSQSICQSVGHSIWPFKGLLKAF